MAGLPEPREVQSEIHRSWLGTVLMTAVSVVCPRALGGVAAPQLPIAIGRDERGSRIRGGMSQ